MPGRTRLYSESIAQDAEARSVEHNIQAPVVRPDFSISFKRRKTMGLNARFDRMLERVDLTLQDHQASSTTASSRQGRARTRSTGSSSVSSGYDVPKTPVDAYDGLENRRLGDTFSVIKMKSAIRGKIGAYYRAGEGYDGSSDIQVEDSDQIITAHKEPLPDWLAITFSKLDPQNPLRRLVSSSTQPPSEVALSHEEPIFAFSHMTQDQNTSAVDNDSLTYQEFPDSALRDWQELNPMDQQSHTNFLLPTLPSPDLITNYSAPRMLQPIALPGSDIDLLPLTDIEHIPLPFSTPGPGSTVSLAQSHDSSPPTVSAQTDNLTGQNRSDVWPVFAMPEPLTHLSMDRIASPALVSTHSRHSIAVSSQPNSEPVKVPVSPSLYRFGDDFANDSFSSDLPPLPVNILELPSIKNPFSKPGPKFHEMHSRPIYFDSPTEDPSNSDPLAPPEGYELDELDFRWEPFMQIGNAGKISDEWDSSVDSDQEHVENPIAESFKVRKDTPESEMTEDEASMMDSDYDRYPVAARLGHFPFYPQGSEDIDKTDPSVSPEPMKIETIFAPAPGIFISPLRNKPTPPMVQDNNIDSSPNSPTPTPVTPRNKSTTLLQVSNTMLTGTSVTRSLQKVQPNQASSRTSTSSLPCSNSVPSRSVNVNNEWQVARGASKVSTREDDSKEQGVLSQVSNDSITSWSEEADGR